MKEASATQPNPGTQHRRFRGEWACLRVAIGRKAGGHVEAGMETEEGTAFESLPRREPCGELPRRAGMAGLADSGLKILPDLIVVIVSYCVYRTIDVLAAVRSAFLSGADPRNRFLAAFCIASSWLTIRDFTKHSFARSEPVRPILAVRPSHA